MRRLVFSVLFLTFFVSAPKAEEFGADNVLEERMFINHAYIPNYRELMRDTVVALAEFAHETNPDFKIIVNEGRDLLSLGQWEVDLAELHRAELAGATTEDERFLLKLFSPEENAPIGSPNRRYLQALDGIFFENSFCGEQKDGKDLYPLLSQFGITVFGIEHCASEKELKSVRQKMADEKIAIHGDTDVKKTFSSEGDEEKPFLENASNTLHLKDVRNVLIMKDNAKFSSKGEWIDALEKTNYDMIVIDPFFRFSRHLNAQDVQRLKHKKLGAKRLVFAVLNVSVAEDTRPYWDLTWKLKSPYWLRFPAEGNDAGVTVDYWNTEWKKILGVYFKEIVNLGYDGVYLEGLDAHKIFERIVPIN